VFGAGVTLSQQDVQRLALGLRELFDKHFALRGRDGIWRACKCAFCLCNLLKENAPDPARSFFVQAEVRALIQDIKGVSKFHQKGGIWSVVHLEILYPIPLDRPVGLRPFGASSTQLQTASRSAGLYTRRYGGAVEKLRTLNTLLEMTKEAEKLASEGGSVERITTLIAEIRRKARQEQASGRGGHGWRNSPNLTRYDLCMIGINEEIGRGNKPILITPALSASFGRILEELDRTIKEVKANHLVM